MAVSKKKPTPLPDTRNPQEIKEIDWLVNACRVLLAKSICWHFIDLLIVPEIAEQKDKNPRYILIKVSEPVSSEHITSPREPIRHPLCRIHHLYSASLHFAYLIVIPNGLLNIRKNFVSILRPVAKAVDKFNDVTKKFEDAHLSVFYSEDGAALLCFSDKFNNLPADILKGSMG